MKTLRKFRPLSSSGRNQLGLVVSQWIGGLGGTTTRSIRSK
jgi:hypothetical protein